MSADKISTMLCPASDSLPPVEALIPHRGTMRLLDRVIGFEEKSAIAEFTPCSTAWYADAAGGMPAWIGIEAMAQTVAAHVAWSKRQQGLPLKSGVLLGTRRYRATCASFAAGAPLRVRVGAVLSDPSGIGAYDCAIENDEGVLAEAVLKDYEPEDFRELMKAQDKSQGKDSWKNGES